MSTDPAAQSEDGAVAQQFQRFEQQRLAEIDGALGQLDEEIREAEQKSKYVIREVVPLVDDEKTSGVSAT